MNVITVTEKNNNQKYDIMIGTGLIFDYQNKKMFHCTDDAEEAEWSDQIFTFEIEGKEVIFYFIEALSYEVVKDMAEVIRIQEIENDLDYIKCERCGGEGRTNIGFTTEEICNECGGHGEKDKSYNEVVNDFIPPVDGQQCPSWVNPTTWNAMQNIMLNTPKEFEKKLEAMGFTKTVIDNFNIYLKRCEEFEKHSPKTLNTKTGCLEPLTFDKLIKTDIFESSTPTMEAREHAKVIIDYLWTAEKQNFFGEYELVTPDDLHLQTVIDWCETDQNRTQLQDLAIHHIFYHLMKLKQLYNL